MKILNFAAWLGLTLLVLEAIAWVIDRLSARVLSIPIVHREKFLDDQSRLLRRLIHDTTIRARIHPVRGWEYLAGHVVENEHMSEQGLRALREYGPEPAPGQVRIAVFGDSFVYGSEVTDAETWPQQIENRWRAEVLNYGVGGYGADQVLLRFREEGTRLRPQIVVFGFTTMMAPRAVSRHRRFEHPQDAPWFKPRFVLEGDHLSLIPTPVGSLEDVELLLANPAKVAEFGKGDFWYTPPVFEHWLYPWSATYRLLTYAWYGVRRRLILPDRIYKNQMLNPGAESFKILSRIVQDFAAAVRTAGAEPVALMLPTRSDVKMFHHIGRPWYETFRAHVAGLDLCVIDPASAFASSSTVIDQLFTRGGHYTGKGSTIVAETLAETLGLPRR